jgi:hypothetical protein
LARVTRDVYRDSLDNLVVVTRGCLSLTLGDDVIYNDFTRQLTFPDGETSSVRGIYRPQYQLTRVDQDLYRSLDGSGYVRTQYCYAYAYGEDVVLLSDSVIFLASRER